MCVTLKDHASPKDLIALQYKAGDGLLWWRSGYVLNICCFGVGDSKTNSKKLSDENWTRVCPRVGVGQPALIRGGGVGWGLVGM
jgi:hypothetical protein